MFNVYFNSSIHTSLEGLVLPAELHGQANAPHVPFVYAWIGSQDVFTVEKILVRRLAERRVVFIVPAKCGVTVPLRKFMPTVTAKPWFQ